MRFMKLGGTKGDESLVHYLTCCLDKYNQRAKTVALVEPDDDEAVNPITSERTQRTVLATWLLELKLNLLEDM